MPCLHPHLAVSSILPLAFATAAELRALSRPQKPVSPWWTPNTSDSFSPLRTQPLPPPPPDLRPEPPLPLISLSLLRTPQRAPTPREDKEERPSLPPSLSPTCPQVPVCQLGGRGASETAPPLPCPCCHSYSSELKHASPHQACQAPVQPNAGPFPKSASNCLFLFSGSPALSHT